MPGFYDVGEIVNINAQFTLSGTATDPTSVIELTVKDPSDVKTVYTFAGGDLDNTAVGRYSGDVFATEHGIWTYRFLGSGIVSSVEESYFTVRRSTVV
jgi:hypothetical protein